MAKTAKQAAPTITRDRTPERTSCPHCGGHLRADYANRRTVHTLAGVTHLTLTIRRCHAPPARPTSGRTGRRPRAGSPSRATSSGWTWSPWSGRATTTWGW